MEEKAVVVEYRAGNGRDGLECSAVIFAEQSSQFHIHRHNSASYNAPWIKLALAFLPEGYPHSVTPDYLAFQTWDTLQGISTYIRSMLSTQALLSGFGVGTSTATALGATFQWFLRDLTGMVSGIVYTLYQGSNLDNRAKQWRLGADFTNDIAMLVDLLSPLFPSVFMVLLCLGSAARAVTGVASGATRAALTQHFARKQNAADVSAKEGSQETAATLVGMILGMILARLTSNNIIIMWICFLLLTVFHMYANYKAVRSLCLTSLNAERVGILLQSFLKEQKVLTPKEASVEEVLLPQLSLFRPKIRVVFGAEVSTLFNGRWEACTEMISKYGKGKYLMYCDGEGVHVVLHCKTSSSDLLVAYTHALLLKSALEDGITNAEQFCINWMHDHFDKFLSLLKERGWNVDHVLISTLEWRAEWVEDYKQK